MIKKYGTLVVCIMGQPYIWAGRQKEEAAFIYISAKIKGEVSGHKGRHISVLG